MTDSKKTAARSAISLHKQKRGLITRQDLLLSAREIFARDGFEQARLEDIASNIGKTRGALYDHFKNKEDVFFAIFKQNKARDLEELGPLLSRAPTIKDQIEALVSYLIEVSQDRQRMLLNLEFKLYAIRHPRRRRRLAGLHDVFLQVTIPELARLLQRLGRTSSRAKRVGCLAIAGIVDGLVLNHLFDPELLDNRQLARYLRECLTRILLEDAEPEAAKKKPAVRR